MTADDRTPRPGAAELEGAAALARRLAVAVRRAVVVPDDALEASLVALFAEGHVLIEDHPGVGKTSLARALADACSTDLARIQGTSDLLPADIVGVNVFDQSRGEFSFHPGPVFANVVLVDELNRASPKTQSGLLEAMEERHVTVDGRTHQLARPFTVIATQNPAEYDGTFPLTQAQLDRFMVRVSLGYPDAAAEAALIDDAARPAGAEAAASVAEVRDVIESGSRVHASQALREYVVELLAATRRDVRLEVGASPRAGALLLRAARVRALISGRDHVLPEDVKALAVPVLAHRLRPSLVAVADGDSPRQAVADALGSVPAL
ncbi:MAG: AAA family ATPase [Solirubrobacterales bacterium]